MNKKKEDSGDFCFSRANLSETQWYKTMLIISNWTEERNENNCFYVKCNEEPVCPHCKSKLKKHSWVLRVKKLAGGIKEWRLIEVRKCTGEGCGRKHRLIPDDQVPYKHYEGQLIEKVADDALTEAEELEAEDYPCEETVARWKVWAEQLKKNAEGHLRLLVHKLLDIADAISDASTSMVGRIRHLLPQGWLAFLLKHMINFGGAGLLPESPQAASPYFALMSKKP